MKINDKRGQNDAVPDVELEKLVLFEELKELIRELKDVTSFKMLLMGIAKSAANNHGLVPPLELLKTLKTSLTALVAFEKKENDKED